MCSLTTHDHESTNPEGGRAQRLKGRDHKGDAKNVLQHPCVRCVSLNAPPHNEPAQRNGMPRQVCACTYACVCMCANKGPCASYRRCSSGECDHGSHRRTAAEGNASGAGAWPRRGSSEHGDSVQRKGAGDCKQNNHNVHQVLPEGQPKMKLSSTQLHGTFGCACVIVLKYIQQHVCESEKATSNTDWIIPRTRSR